MTYRSIIIPTGAQPISPSEPAPVLQWIKVEDLVIDERYQRPLTATNWIAIRKIAGEFMWSRFSAVLVAPIEGGRYAVIDGQHRVHAAAMLGIEQVPALIVLIRAEEQAKAFVDVNTKRTTIHISTLYKAALAAGDKWAIMAHAAVSDAGCRLLTHPTPLKLRKPGDIMSVGLVRNAVDAGKAWTVTTALKAIRAYDTEGSVPLYSDYLLAPVIAAVSTFPADLPSDALVQVFKARRPMLVVDSAHRLAEKEGTSKAMQAKAAFALLIRRAVEGLDG